MGAGRTSADAGETERAALGIDHGAARREHLSEGAMRSGLFRCSVMQAIEGRAQQGALLTERQEIAG